MAEDTEAGAANEVEAQPPKMRVISQYIRDLSFENVAAQKGTATEAKPEISVQVNLDANKKGDNTFEVVLSLNISAKSSDATMFALELEYGGLFAIENIPDEQMHPYLMIECPRILFPFVRRIVSDVSRDGGFPPLNVDNIDFLQLYRSEVARRAAENQDKLN